MRVKQRNKGWPPSLPHYIVNLQCLQKKKKKKAKAKNTPFPHNGLLEA